MIAKGRYYDVELCYKKSKNVRKYYIIIILSQLSIYQNIPNICAINTPWRQNKKLPTGTLVLTHHLQEDRPKTVYKRMSNQFTSCHRIKSNMSHLRAGTCRPHRELAETAYTRSGVFTERGGSWLLPAQLMNERRVH